MGGSAPQAMQKGGGSPPKPCIALQCNPNPFHASHASLASHASHRDARDASDARDAWDARTGWDPTQSP